MVELDITLVVWGAQWKSNHSGAVRRTWHAGCSSAQSLTIPHLKSEMWGSQPRG